MSENSNIKREEIIQQKFINQLKNIKNEFILKKIFFNLHQKRLLNMVKINKKLQNRINIKINDYKEYSEKYSSIEIELIPANNKKGKFINLVNKDNEKYFHIYFDNNNQEEIKRTFLNEDDQIKTIKVLIDHQVTSFCELFSRCKCIESINFRKFCRNNINNILIA